MNPRFRTKEDADLFMECLRKQVQFPEDKWIHPYRKVGNLVIRNYEYRDAQFEVKYLYAQNND